MTEKKLYAVTEGEYSEYHIVTLCSSRAVAEQIAKRLNWNCLYQNGWNGGYDVEEYVDGEVYQDKNLKAYYVRFWGNSGECEITEEAEEEYVYRGVLYANKDGSVSGLYVFARDEQEAKKIASEKRAKFMAEHTGVV